MNYSIGQFIGSIIAIGFLTALLRLIFRRFFEGPALAAVTVAVSVIIATFLYAFGSADGGPPKFGAGIVQYGFGGVIVFFAWLFGLSKKKADG